MKLKEELEKISYPFLIPVEELKKVSDFYSETSTSWRRSTC
ncbi:hypothetical protein LEP1GSC170_1660 [Leptospira interrogans serovar Bataviae str. HAI135]|nr:hypothetical protein LEP1GSC170_1660 [Leptospira interrogans serovar Bataviae str. HAI135]